MGRQKESFRRAALEAGVMSAKTSIEWTAGPDGSNGSTWNPIRGVRGKWSCVKVSLGCQNCCSLCHVHVSRHDDAACPQPDYEIREAV